MKKYFTQHTKKQTGFTLLFAVLVSTLVVSIGASIISIALRQTILSGTSRESQYAFYAANTVLECAFYWDIIGVPNTTSAVFPSDTQGGLTSAEKTLVKCSGMNIVDGNRGTGGNADAWDQSGIESMTTFHLEIKDQADPQITGDTHCAEATITKDTDSTTGITTTKIEAKGYNSCDLDNPRTVERGLIQEYTS